VSGLVSHLLLTFKREPVCADCFISFVMESLYVYIIVHTRMYEP